MVRADYGVEPAIHNLRHIYDSTSEEDLVEKQEFRPYVGANMPTK